MFLSAVGASSFLPRFRHGPSRLRALPRQYGYVFLLFFVEYFVLVDFRLFPVRTIIVPLSGFPYVFWTYSWCVMFSSIFFCRILGLRLLSMYAR